MVFCRLFEQEAGKCTLGVVYAQEHHKTATFVTLNVVVAMAAGGVLLKERS